MNNSLEEIRNVLLNAKSVAVSAHTNPDGDAIGASCALGLCLVSMGIRTRVFIEKFSDTFDIIPGIEIAEFENNGFVPDVYVSVDCGDIERLGEFGEVFKNSPVNINIDHHKSNTFFGMYNYVDENASSASEIIYRLFGNDLEGYRYADKIAGALYSGIVFDTGGFRHTSTGSFTHLVASRLIKYNFDFNKIYNTIFNTRKFEEAKALGIAMGNMEKCQDGKIVYSYITLDEIKKCGTDSKGLSEIINYIKGINGCEAALFVYEKEQDVFKASMRSDDLVDVSEVAKTFGGGGHAKASGCTVMGTKESVLEAVIEEIKKQL